MDKRFALALVAVLGGCGNTGALQSPVIPSAMESLNVGPSWMLPEAKSSDLVYASTFAGKVYVYSYPAGKLVGTLTVTGSPQGECVDKAGNIWVTDDIISGQQKILEYAHGGTSPIRTLTDGGGYFPEGCSVDPNTGDLAVVNVNTQCSSAPGGDFAIFTHAKGTPKIYTDPGLKCYGFVGYDDHSNLFVVGTQPLGLFQFAELPKGTSTFTNFVLNGGASGGVEWNGKYITFGDQIYNTVWQVKVTGSHASFVGETGLFGLTDPTYQYAFAFDAKGRPNRVIALDIGNGGTIAVWKYPAGGSPTNIYPGSYYPSGVALSPGGKSQ